MFSRKYIAHVKTEMVEFQYVQKFNCSRFVFIRIHKNHSFQSLLVYLVFVFRVVSEQYFTFTIIIRKHPITIKLLFITPNAKHSNDIRLVVGFGICHCNMACFLSWCIRIRHMHKWSNAMCFAIYRTVGCV